MRRHERASTVGAPSPATPAADILSFDGSKTIAYALRVGPRLSAADRSRLAAALRRISGPDAAAARLVADFLSRDTP